MQIHLLSVGRRAPGWIQAGFDEYARRMPIECALTLHEVEPVRRGKANSDQAREAEGERLIKIAPKGARIIAVDRLGEAWTTAHLADRLCDWLAGGLDIALLIGGAEGLAASCLGRAERRWSLSPLTFPHLLVRVILAEQLYRAWSLLQNHPYHRA